MSLSHWTPSCANAAASGLRMELATRTVQWLMLSTKCGCLRSAPSYQLRRLWIEEKEFAAYYGGFANEGLWPLCHLVDVRPVFRPEDWAAYQDVNAQFADCDRRGVDHVGYSRVHPGLSSRARRAAASRTTTWRQDRALLAHPMAISGSAPDMSLAPGDPCGFGCKRSTGLSVGAGSPQLPAGDGERTRGRDRG